MDSFFDVLPESNQQQLRYNYFHEENLMDQDILVHPLDKTTTNPISSSLPSLSPYSTSSHPMVIPPSNSPVNNEALYLFPATCPPILDRSKSTSQQQQQRQQDEKSFAVGSLPEPPAPWPTAMMRRPALKDPQCIDVTHISNLHRNLRSETSEELLFKMEDLNISIENSKDRKLQR